MSALPAVVVMHGRSWIDMNSFCVVCYRAVDLAIPHLRHAASELGCVTSVAWYGAQEAMQKRTYGLVTVAAWVLLLVLANTTL